MENPVCVGVGVPDAKLQGEVEDISRYSQGSSAPNSLMMSLGKKESGPSGSWTNSGSSPMSLALRTNSISPTQRPLKPPQHLPKRRPKQGATPTLPPRRRPGHPDHVPRAATSRDPPQVLGMFSPQRGERRRCIEHATGPRKPSSAVGRGEVLEPGLQACRLPCGS